MDGCHVLLSFRRLVIVSGLAAALSVPSYAQENKFAKVDELLKSSGMTTQSSQANPQPVVETLKTPPPSTQEAVRIELPASTVLEESYRNGTPSVNTPAETLNPPSTEQPAQTAFSSAASAKEAVAKTVVMWGSGGGGSTNLQADSGFISEPGMSVNQRATLNAPDVLSVPFVEIPAGSIMEFSDDIAIPASKDGVLFSNGVMTSAIEQRQPNGILQLMADRAVAASAPQIEDCALMSDRSNLLMKGASKHPVKTFLEIDRLELVRQMPSEKSDESPVIAKVMFKTKQSKNANDAAVNIVLLCTLPKEYWGEPKRYSVRDLSTSVGHIFLFKLARVAEI